MPLLDLKYLVDNNMVSPNTPGELSKFLDYKVPQGQFFVLEPEKPSILRLGCYEVFADQDCTPDTITLTLTYQPAKPHPDYLPTWPSYDGYTIKAFVDADDDGTYETQLQITALDFANKQVTLDTSGVTGTHNVRVSYAFMEGSVKLTRETPDNASVEGKRTFLSANPAALNTRDQLKDQPLYFDYLVYLTEFCHLRGYINTPANLDLDPDLGVTQIELFYRMEDLAQAEASYLQAFGGRTPKYPTLYSALVAELTGQKKPTRARR